MSRQSIQRVPVPAGTAKDVADYYFRWVETAVPGVYARTNHREVQLGFAGVGSAAIVLHRGEESSERVAYDVVGGFLVAPKAGGEIAFERVGDEVEIALREFTPRLPPWLFRMTHGPVHDLVMEAFCRHMRIPRLEGQR